MNNFSSKTSEKSRDSKVSIGILVTSEENARLERISRTLPGNPSKASLVLYYFRRGFAGEHSATEPAPKAAN